MNNILPSSLSAYTVSGDTVILLISGSRLFLCISVLCRVIPKDTHWFVYIVRKIRFNSMNHVGHVLNNYFNRTNPQSFTCYLPLIKKHARIKRYTNKCKYNYHRNHRDIYWIIIFTNCSQNCFCLLVVHVYSHPLYLSCEVQLSCNFKLYVCIVHLSKSFIVFFLCPVLWPCNPFHLFFKWILSSCKSR